MKTISIWINENCATDNKWHSIKLLYGEAKKKKIIIMACEEKWWLGFFHEVKVNLKEAKKNRD